jgi:AraC-like DNA-binding protein
MTASAIGLERFDMLAGEAFDRHVHDEHQLAWASSGVVMVDVGDRCWVLPTHLALWIPGGTWHGTAAVRESVLQGIYVDPVAGIGWPDPTVVSVTPLARHLIEHLADDELDDEARARAEAVLVDVLQPAGGTTLELPLPVDPRAREVADLLMASPDDQRRLDELAFAIGSSSRTLLRLFLAETGMTFSDWRVHARLQSAVALLAEGLPVARVADRVGYATPSAFVAAFRRVTGHTPAAYFGRPGRP